MESNSRMPRISASLQRRMSAARKRFRSLTCVSSQECPQSLKSSAGMRPSGWAGALSPQAARRRSSLP